MMGRPSLAPGPVLPVAAGSATLKGSTRNAGMGLAARVTRWRCAAFSCGLPVGRTAAGSFDDFPDAAHHRPREPPAPSSHGLQQRLVAGGLLKGKTVAVDATTLEANAAMRSIVRRDTGESYQEFLTGPRAGGREIATPTREDLGAPGPQAQEEKPRNQDWKYPWDPDAKIAKMKDGRNALGPTKPSMRWTWKPARWSLSPLQDADQGDTTTIIETVIAATFPQARRIVLTLVLQIAALRTRTSKPLP